MQQAIDPVCNMTVDVDTAEYTSDYQGSTYYFCGAGCKRAFDKNPTEFVGQDQQDAGSGGQGSGTNS